MEFSIRQNVFFGEKKDDKKKEILSQRNEIKEENDKEEYLFLKLEEDN
jgi:hypothetical protein